MTKDEILEKLQQVVSKEPSKWHENAQFREENKKWLKRSQTIALTVLRTLRAKNITQKDLAEKMGISAQLINKWIKGKENFTLETISKLEEALNIELITVPNFKVFKEPIIHKIEISIFELSITTKFGTTKNQETQTQLYENYPKVFIPECNQNFLN